MPQGQSYPTTFLRSDNFFIDPITNNLNPNNPAYPYSSIFASLLAALGLTRTLLKTATTFYIATNGSDANPGTSSGAPWLTFAHAMAVLSGQIDFGGQTVTLQAVAGHAAFTTNLVVTPWVGGGAFIFDGGGGSIIAASGHGIACTGALPGSFTAQNVTLQAAAGGNSLYNSADGTVEIGAGVTFGAVVNGYQIAADNPGAMIDDRSNNYSITGGATAHIIAVGGAFVRISGITITLTGTPAFGIAFAYGTRAGIMALDGNTFTGGATGTRYFLDTNSVIYTGNKGATYLPGNAAGVVQTGGQYF